jgi:hypothetical protein
MPKKKRSKKVTVKFEGKEIPKSKLPNGSLFIVSQWYSSASKLPVRLKSMFGRLFRILKGNKSGACRIEADGTLIPIEVPAVDTRSVDDLVSELNRIEKQERQLRGFSKFYWGHMAEQNFGNDKDKAQLYYQECAKLFWLPYATYPKFNEARRLLEEHKASLGAALMKKTYYVVEERSSENEHHIVLHLQPKSMLLPRVGEEGDWYSQNEYAELCAKGEIKEKIRPKSKEEMIGFLQDAREERSGGIDWAENLTEDNCRWGKDSNGRFLRKENIHSNSSYYYYVSFRENPMLATAINGDEDDEDDLRGKIEWCDESLDRFKELERQKKHDAEVKRANYYSVTLPQK